MDFDNFVLVQDLLLPSYIPIRFLSPVAQSLPVLVGAIVHDTWYGTQGTTTVGAAGAWGRDYIIILLELLCLFYILRLLLVKMIADGGKPPAA